MKKLIVLLSVVLICISSFGAIHKISQVPKDEMKAAILNTDLTVYDLQVTTSGNKYYVSSILGQDTGGRGGTSWADSFATVAYAFSRCTAGNGDIIYVSPYHSETIVSATDIDVVEGVTVICLSTGQFDSIPEFLFSTTASTITIDQADIVWVGGLYKSTIKGTTSLFNVSDGYSFNISNAYFLSIGAFSGDTFVLLGGIDQSANYSKVTNCTFVTPNTGNGTMNSAIKLNADHHRVILADNFAFGDFNEACIDAPASGNAQVDLTIKDNVLTNIQAGQHAIQINGTGSTGMIAGNYLSTNSAATDVDAGGLAMVGNYFGLYATDSDTDYGPMDGATVTTFTGYGLDHLGSLADGTGQYPVSVVQDSWMAFLMSKSANPVATSFDNRTDSLEMLSDKLGGFSGDGGANQDDSVKASLDLAHTDLDTTITAVGTTIPAQIEDVNTNILALVADVNTNVLAEIVDSNTNIITLVTDANTNVTAQIADVNTNILTSIGTYFSTTSTVESNDIPNNTQVAGAITGAASGTLLLTDIIVNTDATGWATPTNIEFSTDNAFGNTGADLPVFVEAIASFGTNLTVSKKDATSHTLPVIIESGKKVFIHGDDAAGTGAGYGKVTLVFQRLTAGATITAADLDTD